MRLYTIETGRFKLDGGAMFGVVPKTIWSKTNPADANNRIDLAMRCLLIEDGDKLILIDNGIGNKYDAKFQSIYCIDHESSNLEKSLKNLGFQKNDITDVILTHLHFDHAAGSTEWDNNHRPVLAFPYANYWIQEKHFRWALNPNDREKASFFAENIQPLQASQQLKLLKGETQFNDYIQLVLVNGHTEAQQLPLISYKNYKILFAGDLFPTHGHLPLPYVMGYDVRPLVTLEERKLFLEECVNENIVLFYEHDPYYECGLVGIDEKGKYFSKETFPLTHLT